MGKWTAEQYVSWIEDPLEKQFIISLFNELQIFADFLFKVYVIQRDQPKIWIDDEIINNSRVDYSGIIIYRGLINHCVDAVKRNTSLDLQDLDLRKSHRDRCNIIGGVIYTFAHELTHFVRGHGIIKAKHPELSSAFEYDADNFAAAALFRYYGFRFSRGKSSLEVKKMVLDSMYWPMRLSIGDHAIVDSDVGDHPDTHIRLRTVITKLSIVDKPHVNYGVTEEWLKEYLDILEYVAECERIYTNNPSVSKLSGSQFIDKFNLDHCEGGDPRMIQLLEVWVIAEPLIQNVSFLAADMIMTGKTVSYRRVGEVSIFKWGWQYTHEKISGVLIPNFHAHPGIVPTTNYKPPNYSLCATWVASPVEIYKLASMELNQWMRALAIADLLVDLCGDIEFKTQSNTGE